LLLFNTNSGLPQKADIFSPESKRQAKLRGLVKSKNRVVKILLLGDDDSQ